jgi:hypothetical protein
VEQAQHTHQLKLCCTEEMYTPDGHFDPERMLEVMVGAINEGRTLGFPLTRLMGHPESALQTWKDSTRFLEYEARLNIELPRFDDPVICTYDLDQITAGTAFDAVRTHPMTLLGGVLQENPFYVSPEVFLEELRARTEPRDGPGVVADASHTA